MTRLLESLLHFLALLSVHVNTNAFTSPVCNVRQQIQPLYNILVSMVSTKCQVVERLLFCASDLKSRVRIHQRFSFVDFYFIFRKARYKIRATLLLVCECSRTFFLIDVQRRRAETHFLWLQETNLKLCPILDAFFVCSRAFSPRVFALRTQMFNAGLRQGIY